MITPPKAGDILDHYRIEDLVVRGGMATIFRGTDLDSGRQVAIKVPHPEAECDPVFFERFRREEKIGQDMDHPNIVKALTDPKRSRVYMVQEWVEGRLLREILFEEHKFSAERALRITIGICDALGYIHSRGVVHRDLKPENIMIDEEDRIKLLDFGIAAQSGGRRLTFGKLSQVMGTAEYISPEQVNGKRGDARSDLYALGVMLYEMLTGKTPFRGENPFAIMNDRLRNDPIPPRDVDPSVSLQLQEIIYRALERDPKERYANAEEFSRDLRSPAQVPVPVRGRAKSQEPPRQIVPRVVLFYTSLAAIPAIILGLLLYMAQHQ